MSEPNLDRDEAFKEFEARKQRYRRANQTLQNILEGFLDDLGEKYGVREGLTVIGAPKDFESFYRKATTKYKDECETVDQAFEKVRDLARLRVIGHTLDDCYHLVDLLRAQKVIYVDEGSIEDFIKNPSKTGYRAIHLEVSVDVPADGGTVSVPVELQIRSTLQEAWGHFTHADFYRGEQSNVLVRQQMREFSDLLYWADRHAATLVKEMGLIGTRETVIDDGHAAAGQAPAEPADPTSGD